MDASNRGDTVWIEDGFVCDTGGRHGNRIVISRKITVRSVSGTQKNAAVIVGAHHEPGVTVHGTRSIRCLFVNATATLIGLQLTNGAASNGGGAFMVESGTRSTFSNCVFVANNAANNGGGLYEGRAEQCHFTDNEARAGGATFGGTLSDCTIVSNRCSWSGGGVASATLSHCLLAFNTATQQNGGGAADSVLSDCVLTGNSCAYIGAAIFGGTALRCTITNNANGRISGGVISDCVATQCLIKDNTFDAYGGGVVRGGQLINCLVTSNKVSNSQDAASAYKTQIFNSTLADNSSGRAAVGCTLINSIVWGNPEESLNNNATNSCIVASAVLTGEKNIDGDPLFVGTGDWPYRLSESSPCVNQGMGGFAWMQPSDPDTRGFDLSGRERVIGPAVDLGAFEYKP